ncbi:probable E3 ubiquitin ligase sud1 [Phtheirospermum japonicum]|uniref:Probable E3 ubiquitin ligase sud1 n=1 Tax=Phtheirospermum japonicum TaxID=374723 RepID=A0A830DDC0_9LAMI|nr:probable E3 ubiquitin ligase sud1 [Phtheirospermum japonicum]
MVCVDRIIATAACFQQESSSSANSVVREREGVSESVSDKDGIFNVEDGSFSGVKAKGSVRECRICQEEDEEKDMEAPCACNGTLKFAHRKCIQRWCNKKGDITCEICNQIFSPNYSSPPPRSNADVMTIDIRQAWGPHIDLRDPRFLAFAAAERQFLQSEYDDYALANSGTLTCFRTVALILMVLLLIRQTLMLTRDFGMLRESSVFFHYQISILQLAGFLLPCYVLARSWYIVQCRRRRQVR